MAVIVSSLKIFKRLVKVKDNEDLLSVTPVTLSSETINERGIDNGLRQWLGEGMESIIVVLEGA